MMWSISHMLIFHLCIFFDEISVKVFDFTTKKLCFFIVEFYVLCIFWLTVLYQICILQIYPPRLWLIILLTASLQCRAFNFNEAQFTSAFFRGSYQRSCILKKSSSNPRYLASFLCFPGVSQLCILHGGLWSILSSFLWRV